MRALACAFALQQTSGAIADEALASAVGKSNRFVLTKQVLLMTGAESRRRPDLSIAGLEGDSPAFQILIEAKVESPFHRIPVDGSELIQPAAYIEAWRNLGDDDEAPVRRVGALLRTPVEWRDEVPVNESSPVQPTKSDRSWMDILVLLADAISARLTSDTDAVKELGPALLMAWLLQEIYAIAVQKRDGRVNPATSGDSAKEALVARAEQSQVRNRRAELNHSRPEDSKLKPLTLEAREILDSIVPRRIRLTVC